ncbi:MAG: FAD-dependent oxidoreductase, partial [Pygmaiobacter sp.]
MQSAKKLTERLQRQFGNVTAREENGILFLEGSLAHWDEVVAAGQLCADKKSRRMLVNNIMCAEFGTPMIRPSRVDTALAGRTCDVLVIGAGVVGCAIARELSRTSLDVLLVEKEHDVALHASSRNDGMVHPGIELKPYQKKQSYNLRGNAMYPDICKELEVPFARTGQILGVCERWMRFGLPLITGHWKRMG